MSVPISQMWTVTQYVLKQKILRRKRYPLVLMLEPLLRCNLACSGCGKIQYPSHILKHNLTVDKCIAAVEECGAPIVSIPGGEPLLYPHIAELVSELVQRKKYVYVCTNALLLKEKLTEGIFSPSKYLTFSVHMDGLKEEHDNSVCKPGVYDLAIEGIKAAVALGHRVTTNTTIFNNAEPFRIRQFFDAMTDLNVEGMMISPGYSYEKAPDQENFLGRDQTIRLFREILSGKKRSWKFNHSPLFLKFLMGEKDFECTPWGNPLYNLFGWQRPCYLMQEGYASSYRELIEDTAWENYGKASGNPKCSNCMVHSGYEPTAVNAPFNSLSDMKDTVIATFSNRL